MEAGQDSWGDWFERVYPELGGAGLWLRGGELNTLPEAAMAERPFRVLFARLSTYHDTADSFTHGLLYQIAAGLPGIYPDLAFLPPAQDLPLFRREQVPWLLGTQSKRGPRSFQLIGFSLSVAQELMNLPAMLRESGLPISKAERLRRPELPLIILGGSSALYSSVGWGADPWVDAVFMGESDQAIRRLLEILRDGHRAGLGKRALLAALGEVPGMFEPDAPRSIRRAACLDLDAAEALERAPIPFLRDRVGSGQLQLSQGCPCLCTFCAESWDRKPYRERSLPRLLEAAWRLKAGMAVESLELFAASPNAHRSFYPLLWELAAGFGRLRLKSQRFDLLAAEPALIELQRALGKSSLTCGLEGISPRLRRYLRKSLADQDLQRALQLIFAAAARELKIFLIATGLEEEADFHALEELLGMVAHQRQQAGAGTRCIFSMTPLVRFPWTPLELEDAPDQGSCERIVRRTARAVRAAGFEFREAADLEEYWVSQVLVRADRPEVGQALQAALQASGFLYYRRVEPGFVKAFRQALRELGVDPAELLAGAGAGARPWSLIETGVSREFLLEAAQQARGFVDEGYCLGRAGQRVRCAGCGACTPEEVATLVTARREPSPGTPMRFRERLAEAKKREVELRFRVEAGPAARGVPRRLLSAALLQAILRSSPQLVRGFRRYGSAYFEQEGKPVWLEGADVLALSWDGRQLPRLLELARDPAARAEVNRSLADWGSWEGLVEGEWRPRELRLQSSFQFHPDPYLASLGLKFTRRREPPAGYRLELAPAARRKGLLEELSWCTTPDGVTEVHAVPGPKLQIEELLRRGFQLPGPEQWVRVRARVIGPPA